MISQENFLERPENFCHFFEKMLYARKQFGYVWKMFLR